jgi:hypothetical protein
MNRLFKTAVLSVAVAATTLAALPAANAGDRYWRRGDRHYHQYNYDSGDLAAAGILGLAAGALVVGLASQPEPEPVYANPYRQPRPRPIREYPETVYLDEYAGGLEPWSAEWYDYCSDRYRSFNPRSGTFVGYDGQEHFCVAN